VIPFANAFPKPRRGAKASRGGKLYPGIEEVVGCVESILKQIQLDREPGRSTCHPTGFIFEQGFFFVYGTHH
jgi:hypothetical protein